HSYYFRFEQLPLKALQIHLEFADDDIVHLLLSLFDYILLTFVLASFYPIVQYSDPLRTIKIQMLLTLFLFAAQIHAYLFFAIIEQLSQIQVTLYFLPTML